MKYLLFILLITFSTSVSATTHKRNQEDHKTVYMTSDGWCPFTCLHTDKNKGLFYDVATAAFAQSGYQTVYVSSSWDRAIHNVKTGKFDILLGANTTQQKDFLLNTDFFVPDRTAFAVLKNSDIKIHKGEDLNAYRIGKVQGYSYDITGVWEVFIQNNPNTTDIASSAGEKHLLDLVARQRIEVAVLNHDVASHYMKVNQLLTNIHLIQTDMSSDLYVGFFPSERGELLRELFAKGFKAVVEKDLLKPIYDKYQIEMPDFN